MEVLYFIVIAAVMVIIGGLIYFWRTKAKVEDRLADSLVDRGISETYFQFKKQFDCVSPKGVVVRSTVQVPDRALRNIDIGIQNQLDRHNRRYPEWARGKSHSEYTALFLTPMTTNEIDSPGSPALIIKGYQSSGTTVGRLPASAEQNFIVLPHQEETQWKHNDYLMRSAWNESEHTRESLNDINVFYEYAIAGDVHPHVDYVDMIEIPAEV